MTECKHTLILNDDDGRYCATCYEPMKGNETMTETKTAADKTTTSTTSKKVTKPMTKKATKPAKSVKPAKSTKKAGKANENPFASKLTETDTDKMFKMYEDGAGLTAIARSLGVTVSSVKARMLSACLDELYDSYEVDA